MRVSTLEFDKVFLGHCMGVGLSPRGPQDPHICFTCLVEDDGHWGVSQNSQGPSSAWLDEMIDMLEEARDWIGKHADPDMHDGHQYGWRFRPMKSQEETG